MINGIILDVTTHKCNACGHSWTHSTCHANLNNAYIGFRVLEKKYFNEPLKFILPDEHTLTHPYCFRCALQQNVPIGFPKGPAPERKPSNSYADKDLDDLIK